jgi:hypothetical protein
VASVRLLLIALVLVPLSSCIKVPNLLAPQKPVDFCIEQAKQFCALEFRCCTAAERASDADPLQLFNSPIFTRHPLRDEGDCVDVVAEVCRGQVDAQNEALDDERLKFDPDEASSCLAELQNSVDDCEPEGFFKDDGTYIFSLIHGGGPGVLGSACEDVIRGNVDEHDTCFAGYECKDGGCVVTDPNGDRTIKGECEGTGHPPNPFSDANVDLQFCDGLKDNQP